MHDHPWAFVSIVLWGGYIEERANIRDAPNLAQFAQVWPDTCRPGVEVVRRRWSVRMMRLDEAHRITQLTARRTWTLVVHGPERRIWGFYLPGGWMGRRLYERVVRGTEPDLVSEPARSPGRV